MCRTAFAHCLPIRAKYKSFESGFVRSGLASCLLKFQKPFNLRFGNLIYITLSHVFRFLKQDNTFISCKNYHYKLKGFFSPYLYLILGLIRPRVELLRCFSKILNNHGFQFLHFLKSGKKVLYFSAVIDN